MIDEMEAQTGLIEISATASTPKEPLGINTSGEAAALRGFKIQTDALVLRLLARQLR